MMSCTFTHIIYVGQKIGHVKENREIDNNFSQCNFVVTVVDKCICVYLYRCIRITVGYNVYAIMKNTINIPENICLYDYVNNIMYIG